MSHATDAPVHNLLGRPGAIMADLLMQLLGLGSLALLLPIAVWGYRLLGHRPLSRERLRVVIWLIGAVLAAAFVACLPPTPHWPLPSGLGGVVGDAILRLPTTLFHASLTGTNRLIAASILGGAALIAFAIAAGIIWHGPVDEADDEDYEDETEAGEDDDDRAWISLGFLAHTLLSFRSRVARLLQRTPAPQRAAVQFPARNRIEPQFVKPVIPLVPSGPDDDDDDGEDEAPPAPRKPRPTPKPLRRAADGYALPSLNLLTAPRQAERTTLSAETIRENGAALEGVLGISASGQIVKVRPGPVVTLYELEPAPGTKSSRVIGLADDIARSMSAALGARRRRCPAATSIGIELPNPTRETVYLRELLAIDGLRDARPQAAAGAGQGHRRPAGHRRPGPHAASADRRHHRLGQVGGDQHHDPVAALSAAARAMPLHHGRSQDARTLGL